MKKLLVLASALGVLAIMAAKPAMATDLSTGTATWQYYATGVLAGGTVALPGDSATWGTAVNTNTTGWLGSAWTGTGTGASWVSPQASYQSGQSDAAGYYLFRTSFDVTAAQAAAGPVSISGSFLTDNQAGSVAKNDAKPDGVQPAVFVDSIVDPTLAFTPTKDLGYTDFNTTAADFGGSKFLEAGTHYVYFLVHNQENSGFGNPVALNAKLDVTAAPVPEPAFVQLGVLLSSGGLLALRRRRA